VGRVLALVAVAAIAGGAGAGSARAGSRARRPVTMAASMTAPATARIIETTPDLVNALTVKRPRAFAAAPARGSAVIEVNPAVRYQTILGFGGAMTDTSAWLLRDELGSRARKIAFQALFGAAGLDLDYVRIPMGGSDFTRTGTPYTYDDRAPGKTDPSLAHFSIAHDRAYILPALREMLAIDPGIFTLASPWTPPPWMKANDAYDNVKLGGTLLVRDYPAWAQYFVKFLRAYGAAGVPVDAITPMNEPTTGRTWPGSAFFTADQVPWLTQDLAPALQAARLHPRIYGDDDVIPSLEASQVLLNGPAASELSGMAYHCYLGMAEISALHAEYPNEQILMNECSPGIIPYAPAEVGIDATRNWASGVQLWNLALDQVGGPVQAPNAGCHGCTAIMSVDTRTHTPRFGLTYDELGQMSRYVHRGAVRIASTRLVAEGPNGYGVTTGVDDVAFTNPNGSTVLVAYNSSHAAKPVAIDEGNRYLNWTMAPGSTVTFTWH
jgi:glucosylceramidase